jgi:hypothetical protein
MNLHPSELPENGDGHGNGTGIITSKAEQNNIVNFFTMRPPLAA